jgi:hypothetical protein
MASDKYAVTNMMREDYIPFKKYCNDHDIVIKDALAEATKMWLAEQTLLESIKQVYIENKIDLTT